MCIDFTHTCVYYEGGFNQVPLTGGQTMEVFCMSKNDVVMTIRMILAALDLKRSDFELSGCSSALAGYELGLSNALVLIERLDFKEEV